jgi:neurofibromin 1
MESKQRYESSKPNDVNERAIRPNNVPGRLLNMALINIGSEDPNLRLVAYNLLYSLSISFRFDVGNQLLNARGNLREFFNIAISKHILNKYIRSLYSFELYQFYCQN